MDVANGNIGTVGKYDVSFTSGQMVVEMDVASGPASASLSIKISGKQILDALAAKIGGPIPAEVAQLLENALGM